jgi:hypothetical protein
VPYHISTHLSAHAAFLIKAFQSLIMALFRALIMEFLSCHVHWCCDLHYLHHWTKPRHYDLPIAQFRCGRTLDRKVLVPTRQKFTVETQKSSIVVANDVISALRIHTLCTCTQQSPHPAKCAITLSRERIDDNCHGPNRCSPTMCVRRSCCHRPAKSLFANHRPPIDEAPRCVQSMKVVLEIQTERTSYVPTNEFISNNRRVYILSFSTSSCWGRKNLAS